MVREDPPHRRVLTKDEFDKLLSTCTGRQQKLLKLIANTGLRAAEVQKLTAQNVVGDFIVIDGKGRKRRVIPLNKTTREICSDLSFLERYRKRNAVYSMMRYRCGLVHLLSAGPHALRHMLATELAQQDVPIYRISKLLGHADLRTTERVYVNLSLESAVAGVTDNLDF